MKRSPKHPPDGARRAPSPAPGKSQGERRTEGERRNSEENRREFERFSPTTPRPSERRRIERRTGSH